MRFWQKIALMPALAGLAFLGVFLLNSWTGGRNSRLIAAIQNDYEPALERTRDLRRALDTGQRLLQDAVAASDPEGLVEAQAALERVLRDTGGPGASPLPAELDGLARELRGYFTLARRTSARMIAGENGEDMQRALYEMSERYNRLRDRLASETRARRAAMAAALGQTLRNQARATTVVGAILGLALAALGVLSARVISSTRASISAAIHASNALAAGDLSAELSSRSRDEIGQILRRLIDAQIRQRHLLAALRESEHRYRTLFENNPVPMWVYDKESLRFLAVNDAAVETYGYSREDFLDMTIADIRPPEDAEAVRRTVAEAPAGLGRSGVWRHRRKDGTLLEAEVTSHGLDFGGYEARLVLAVDVTERRRLEDQLRQAQKMEAVGRLAGGIAHDFNNLLGVIIGYGEIMLRRIPAQDPLYRNATQMLKASQRAADLTRQLLAFSRKQVLQPTVLDLNAVVGEMERMLPRLIGETIQLSVRKDATGQVKADAGQIEQVLMNLAVNARDAMPDGGRLAIETEDVVLDEASVRGHAGAQAGPHVLLAVSDTGHGMDAATSAHVFEPFFTTKEPGKGTGLGLATVYGIVKQSGGCIQVYSEVGRGTTFRIYLPRVEEPPVPKAEPPVGPTPRGSETVLVLEDEPSLRGLVRETLEGAGYGVVEAGTPLEGLDLVRVQRGAIDLILTDVVMPGMSGREFVTQAREACPEAAVVYMSGYTDDAIGQHGVLDEGTHFLQKPFAIDALLQKVREALDGRAVTVAPSRLRPHAR